MAASVGVAPGNDYRLYLRNVKNEAGVLLTTATVTYVIRTKHRVDGEYVQIDSGTLSKVSDGNFEKVIDALVTDELEFGVFYKVIVTCTSAGQDLKKVMSIHATERS